MSVPEGVSLDFSSCPYDVERGPSSSGLGGPSTQREAGEVTCCAIACIVNCLDLSCILTQVANICKLWPLCEK